MNKARIIPPNAKSSIAAIFAEFITHYPKHFAALFVVLVFEGLVAGGAVLAVVPLADFLVDPTLRAPSRITRVLLQLFQPLDVHPNVWIFGLLFVFANLLKGLLDVATRYSILRIKYAVMRGLFADALATFFAARWEFFNKTEQGRLLNTLNKELTTIGDTLGHLATQLAQLVQLCIYLSVPLWLNPLMTLTAVSLAVLFGSPLLLLQKLGYRLGQKNTETANVLMGVISEILSAARLILGFGRQRQSLKRFVGAFDNHVEITLRSQTLTSAIGLLYQPIGMLAAIIALGIAWQHGHAVGEMAALLWSLLRALPVLGSLISTNVNIMNFLPSYEQLVSLRERARRLEEVQGDRIFGQLESGIVLEDVHFSYPGRHKTLRGINIVIRKGQMTALVGSSGSGKSTVIDLVIGLQIPDRGNVLLDGIPLGQWNQNSFRERVGYVPQDPLLFHTSIRENLLWARPQATEADLWHACCMANAEDFVRGLPEGLDTVVGDRGVQLSGGQRQRIALARALLRKPELLLLDEATSSLDSESERLIQASIDDLAQETTVIMVAHRLSTIARADQVYVLRDGRIVENGRYVDLKNKQSGVLSNMIAAQHSLEAGATG